MRELEDQYRQVTTSIQNSFDTLDKLILDAKRLDEISDTLKNEADKKALKAAVNTLFDDISAMISSVGENNKSVYKYIAAAAELRNKLVHGR